MWSHISVHNPPPLYRKGLQSRPFAFPETLRLSRAGTKWVLSCAGVARIRSQVLFRSARGCLARDTQQLAVASEKRRPWATPFDAPEELAERYSVRSV